MMFLLSKWKIPQTGVKVVFFHFRGTGFFEGLNETNGSRDVIKNEKTLVVIQNLIIMGQTAVISNFIKRLKYRNADFENMLSHPRFKPPVSFQEFDIFSD